MLSFDDNGVAERKGLILLKVDSVKGLAFCC